MCGEQPVPLVSIKRAKPRVMVFHFGFSISDTGFHFWNIGITKRFELRDRLSRWNFTQGLGVFDFNSNQWFFILRQIIGDFADASACDTNMFQGHRDRPVSRAVFNTGERGDKNWFFKLFSAEALDGLDNAI